jgi:putative ABC transport system permease protein
MLRTYLKTAWRNLLKHQAFSFINIFGLAVGLAAFGFIALYVADELSYDRYHKNADKIFRVVQHGKWDGGSFDLAVTSAPFAAALKNDFKEVEQAVRLHPEGGGKISYENKSFVENNILFADDSFFKVFTYDFLYGDPETALSEPQSIVLTKALATKLFGDPGNALNKSVLFDGNFPNKVTAVIDEVPGNSHFSFTALRALDKNYTAGWGDAELYTYILLKESSDHAVLESQSASFNKKYLQSDQGTLNFQLELQPLTSIHLQSQLSYEMGNNGDIKYIYVFSLVGLLILIIAIINYVNLTTARSSSRVREIGVRKVIGSGRTSLMYMFMCESILLTAVASAVAACLVFVLMPYFNQISGKLLNFEEIGIFKSILTVIIFAVFTGILSGLYPMLFLSGFRTIPALKGQLGSQSSTTLFRQSLVTFQFVITITMIAGSLIIYQQLDYVMAKDLGFNKSQTLTFHLQDDKSRSRLKSIKDRLLKSPIIESVGAAGNPIGNNNLGSDVFNLNANGETGQNSKIAQNLLIDADFIPTMEIELLKGRNFSAAMPTDKTDAVIINETLVKEMGWNDPIGRRVLMGTDNGVAAKSVIGVVKDFNTYSLQHKVAPLVLRMVSEAGDQDNIYVRLRPGNIQESLNYIRSTYAEFDPENKPDLNFLDENFARQYQSEEKQADLLMVFTVLAISIASLGLLGLATFAAQQRTREIGIRKVLGATVASITLLLSKDLMKLVLIAIVLSVPIAVWTTNKWLQNFAYRIDIEWWVFVVAGLAAIAVALLPLGSQALKAAFANPVKSLRSE